MKTDLGFKINQDHSPLKQPDGTYGFALNAITDPDNLSSISNEPGNTACVNLPGNIAGSISIDRSRKLVFAEDNSISLVNLDNCSIESLVQLDCFNFSSDYPITGSHRVVRGCEDVVYFNDFNNPDRFINISRLEKHKTDGAFDCSKFEFSPNVQHSTIEREILNTGGQLEYGVYNFAIEFLNQNEDTLFVTPVDINYTPVTDNHNTGSLNINTALPDIGGRPLSGKSIKLKVSNIPEDAVIARIVVFRHTTSDGITSDAHVVGSLLPIANNYFEYTYRGFFVDNGDYLVDKNEYLRKKVVYQTGMNNLQVHKRLLRYNMKETVKDYSHYQEYASKIVTKYVAKEVQKDNKNIYYLNRTFMGGEIFLPCITFVHCDGTISPEFPLVGRTKLVSDETLVDNIRDTEIAGISFDNVLIVAIEGQFHTVVQFDYSVSNFQEGLQLKIKYTTQQERIIPLDESNSVHFNFDGEGGYSPTLYIVTSQGESYLGPLTNGLTAQFGIVSTQVEKWLIYDTSIPDSTPETGFTASGLPGYYESNETYTNPPNYCGDSYWGLDADGNSLDSQPVRLFVFPDRSVVEHETETAIQPIGLKFSDVDYPDSTIVGHYFSIVILNQSNIEAKGIGINNILSYDSDNPSALFIQPYYNHHNGQSDTGTSTYNFVTDEVLISNQYVNGNFIINEGTWAFDLTQENYQDYTSIFDSGLSYDDLRLYWLHTDNAGYSTVIEEGAPINDSIIIDSRTTTEGITNYSLSNPFHHINLGSTLSNGNLFKYLSARNSLNPIPNIWSIQTRRITNLSENVSFAGDYFISPLEVDNVADISILKRGVLNVIFGQDTNVIVRVETLQGFFVESKVNNYLRFDGTDKCNKNSQHIDNVYNLFLNKLIEPYNDKFKLRDSICQFFPGYNKDYSVIQSLNRFTPLAYTYDFCSQCTGLYANRIVFSPQSFSEDLSDNFRILNPNDYIDIPGDKGAIIAIDYKDGKLICRTEQSCFIIAPNPQQLETNDQTVYIGTGDFLSVPPQELNVSEVGYGGQQHKLDSINSESGLIWGDRRRGEIYRLADKFSVLSENGLYSWFKKNLRTNPDNHLLFTYDVYTNRVIMTKKNEWTLSYCFRVDGWKSWHSYIPDMYLYDSDTFYPVYNNKLWKQGSSNYCEFFTFKFPHIAEYTIKDYITFKALSLQWISQTFDGSALDLNTTYSSMVCFNSIQSSGNQLLYLDSDTNIYYDSNVTYVMQADGNYKVSGLKDLATSSIIWSDDISSIKQGNNQGYIDRLPVVDYNKPQVEQGDFRDKWLSLRLFFNNTTKKIVLNLGGCLELYSVR